jgi:hypothetical protein
MVSRQGLFWEINDRCKVRVAGAGRLRLMNDGIYTMDDTLLCLSLIPLSALSALNVRWRGVGTGIFELNCIDIVYETYVPIGPQF